MPASLLVLYVPSVCLCVFALYILYVSFTAVLRQWFGLVLYTVTIIFLYYRYMSNLKPASLAVTTVTWKLILITFVQKVITFAHLNMFVQQLNSLH